MAAAGNERTRLEDEEAQRRQNRNARRRRSRAQGPYNVPSDYGLRYPTFSSFEERDDYIRRRLRSAPQLLQRIRTRVQEDTTLRRQLMNGLRAERRRIREERKASDSERRRIEFDEGVRVIDERRTNALADLERQINEANRKGYQEEDDISNRDHNDEDHNNENPGSLLPNEKMAEEEVEQRLRTIRERYESDVRDLVRQIYNFRGDVFNDLISNQAPNNEVHNNENPGQGSGSNGSMEDTDEDDEDLEGTDDRDEDGDESIGSEETDEEIVELRAWLDNRYSNNEVDNIDENEEESEGTDGALEDPEYSRRPSASPLFNSARRQSSLLAWRRRSPHSSPREGSRPDGDPSSSSSERPPWPSFNPKDRTTWGGIDPRTDRLTKAKFPRPTPASDQIRRIRTVLVGENMAHFVPRRGDLLIAHPGTGMPLNSKGYLTTYEGPNSDGFRSQFQRVLLLVRVGQYQEAGPNMFVHKPYRNLQLYRSSFQGMHNNRLKFIFLGNQVDMKKPQIPLDNSPGKFFQAGMPVSSAGHLGINPLVPRRGDVIILQGAWLEDFPHAENFRSSLVKWHRDSPIQFKPDDMLLRLFVEKERAPFQWIKTGERLEGDRDPPFPGYAELYRFDGPGVGWVFWGRSKHLFDTPYEKGFGLRVQPYVLDDGKDSDGVEKKQKGKKDEDDDDVDSDESDCRTRGHIGQFS